MPPKAISLFEEKPKIVQYAQSIGFEEMITDSGIYISPDLNPAIETRLFLELLKARHNNSALLTNLFNADKETWNALQLNHVIGERFPRNGSNLYGNGALRIDCVIEVRLPDDGPLPAFMVEGNPKPSSKTDRSVAPDFIKPQSPQYARGMRGDPRAITVLLTTLEETGRKLIIKHSQRYDFAADALKEYAKWRAGQIEQNEEAFGDLTRAMGGDCGLDSFLLDCGRQGRSFQLDDLPNNIKQMFISKFASERGLSELESEKLLQSQTIKISTALRGTFESGQGGVSFPFP